MLEALAGRGHQVRVLARLESFGETEHEKFLGELAARGMATAAIRNGGVGFERNGVTVCTVTRDPRLRVAFAKEIEEFDPDVILCSTDDPGALLLEVALRAPRAQVVYLVRATVAVPFGPDCSSPNPAKAEMLRRVDSMIGVSEYVANYCREWSGFPAIHVPISLLDPGDYASMGRFDNEFVLMVNPCAVKGISIFTALAQEMPKVRFAAVPTWGTNAEDLAELRGIANIQIFEPVDDMALILHRTRVVLVPSVWAEARSRMVVEAMIRGIPVMASDVGGLHEAKLGVEYLLPVNPIRSYRARVDANMVPVAEVPAQDIGPWRAALSRLVTDRAHYEDVSHRSRVAALEYAEQLHVGWLEAHLLELIGRPKRVARARAAVPATEAERLSPAKRQLLALRIRQKAARASGFFPMEFAFPSAKRTLFCFPWAGAGAAVYRTWNASLGQETEVFAARLPGRETRMSEASFTEMGALVEALLEAIRPHLTRPFILYGHSMGAGIAFELARALRRNGMSLPKALVVSSARAPQLRTDAAGTDPDDAELLLDSGALGAMPDDAESRRLLLPVLRADTHLYRHYLYCAEAPFEFPIMAFHGVDDPSLSAEHVAGWTEQSTSPESEFALLPGGHFFVRTHAEEFLRRLADCVAEVAQGRRSR